MNGPSIKSKTAVRCPNEFCDPEDGCCVCEHTGWVYEWVIEAMTPEPEEFKTVARRSPIQVNNVPLEVL